MDVGKREDALLEKIRELCRKRDNTLRTCDAIKISSPDIAELIDFIILELK